VTIGAEVGVDVERNAVDLGTDEVTGGVVVVVVVALVAWVVYVSVTTLSVVVLSLTVDDD
jgi:hypothetical protein